MTNFKKQNPPTPIHSGVDGFNIRFIRGTRNKIRGALWITLKQLRSS